MQVLTGLYWGYKRNKLSIDIKKCSTQPKEYYLDTFFHEVISPKTEPPIIIVAPNNCVTVMDSCKSTAAKATTDSGSR